MIRRSSAVLAAAVCAVALSGCATFTQDDVVASVNDVELDGSEFEARYAAVAGDPADGRLGGEAARSVVTSWILEQVLDDVGLVDRYESGPEASGITCVSLVRPTDIVIAEQYVERLEQGEDWSGFIEAEFPGTPDNGNVSCIPTESLGPLAPQLAGMTLDDPYALFLFEDQTPAVLRMRSTAEIDPLELAAIAQAIDPTSVEGIGDALDDAVVVVDPQFGAFDPSAGGVVPLG